MANGDLLRQLFKGYAKRDEGTFRNAAEAIIEEERSKNHRLLADDLEKILINNNGQHISKKSSFSNDIPKDRERGFPLVEIKEYTHDWDRLILNQKYSSILKEISKEHYKKDILAASGIKPKQKILFYGPPGCGKTLAAKVISGVLSYPLVTIRFDAIVSSYLGETAANLRKVFDFIQKGCWVVLFDEFDAIGKDRDNPYEHGELKRVVNSLLQLMDAFEGESLIIAATNHEGLLDEAIWRRFEAIIPFSLPSAQDRILLLRLFLKSFDTSLLDLTALGNSLKGATGSDIEQITKEAIRHSLLENHDCILKDDIEHGIQIFQERLSIVKKLSKSKNSTKVTICKYCIPDEDTT